MAALPRRDLKLTGKLPELHRYLFLHLPTFIQPNPSHIHLQVDACTPRNGVYSVAPGLRCIPPYKTRHPPGFSSTHSAQLHPLALSPLDIFITLHSQKLRPCENVSQRWFSVFVFFSQQRLTEYRLSTDAFMKPAVISLLCRAVCKTVTGQIACSAGGTSTPSVNAVCCPSIRMIYSRLVLFVTGCKSTECNR